MFNGKIYFLGALYHVRGEFSHLPSFLRKFSEHLNALPYEHHPVLDKVHQLRLEFEDARNRRTIGKEEALKLMLAKDLFAVEDVLKNADIAEEIAEQRYIENKLYICRDEAVKRLLEVDVQVDYPPLFFVDGLPKPYAQTDYSAFTADEGDHDKYGIDPGLYFPKKRLRPFYSSFLLVHELIHVVLGKKDPYMMARGLEEGLAELIGAMYLSSKVLGKDLTVNLFIYNRLSYGHQQFWELYMDNTRLATLLYRRFGLQGLLHILKKGRQYVKMIERYCLQMEFEQIDLPQGDFDKDLTDISDFLALAFGRNLVVSPLAKYLTEYIRPKMTVAEILGEARVDKVAGKKALKELEDRVYLVSFSCDCDNDHAVVTWTDCDRLYDGPVIRYEIPTAVRT